MQDRSRDINSLKNILFKTTRTKKHSAYQILPNKISDLMGDIDVKFNPKYEEERLAYITSRIEITDKCILDIGCNTGYFLFELLDMGAKKVTGYEGGQYHYEFVKLASKLLNKENDIEIRGDYFTFGNLKEKYDIILLLNVLHHIGDDYGDRNLTLEKARRGIIQQLDSLKRNTDILVFQIGFNWQGNIKQCLFENGTKAEMISFIKKGVEHSWDVLAIGVAESTNNGIIYADLNDKNIVRDDSLGEFLNRPMFVLKSKNNQ
jgi:SAM-dependent methyltransferase